jgi:hypothetical protein
MMRAGIVITICLILGINRARPTPNNINGTIGIVIRSKVFKKKFGKKIDEKLILNPITRVHIGGGIYEIIFNPSFIVSCYSVL